MESSAIDGRFSSGQMTQAPSPRLAAAAHEFEAQMMKELMKPMTAQDGLTSEDADAGGAGGGMGALGEFASDALGQALSRGGGFGIADRIVSELSSSGRAGGTREVSGTTTGNSQRKLLFH